MIGLRNRVHMFTHPKNKDKSIEFFTNILGCKYTEGFFYFQIPGGQVMRIKLP